MNESEPIGVRLVREGLITEAQLRLTLKHQERAGGKTVELLLLAGYLHTDDLRAFLAKQPGTPSVDLNAYHFSDALTSLIPRAFAEANEVFPIDRIGRSLTVAMAFPLDRATIAELEAHTGLRVQPVLCNPDHLADAIARYYPKPAAPADVAAADPEPVAPDGGPAPEADGDEAPHRDGVGADKLKNLAGLVRRIEALPPLPESVRLVQAALADESVSMQRVAETLARDPGLAAKVLSVVNAPGYGLGSRVVAVRHAVALLGLRELYRAVLAAAVPGHLDAQTAQAPPAFWRYSEQVANWSVVLGRATGATRTGAWYTAGLLHDIGRLVLAALVGPAYLERCGTALGGPLVTAEQEAFGMAHPEAGWLLAESWGLPTALAEVLRLHHAPAADVEQPALLGAVAVAQAMPALVRGGEPITEELLSHDVQAGLAISGLEPGALEALRQRTLARTASLGDAG